MEPNRQREAEGMAKSGEGSLSIAIAESCTGGRLGDRITNRPGSSTYFIGGIVAYDNRIKEEFLGVRQATLSSFGAVSAETAIEMAAGIRERFGSEIGLSITGTAGPAGGTAAKPVGTVFIGMAVAGKVSVREHHFSGSRDEIKEKSVSEAIKELDKALGS